MRPAVFAAAVCALAGGAGCGYHVAGKTNLLPDTIQTICIPAFSNATVRYKLTDRIPEALAREFIARTKYRIVSNPDQADAVLRGTVINYFAYPTVFDQTTGRASTIQFMVTLQASLVERATGKVLYSNPNFTMKNQYEVSIDPHAYFEESDTAMDRLSREVAQTLVSAILENF